MSRWKQVVGDGLRAHTDGRRATKGAVAVHTLNRMLELGRPSCAGTILGQMQTQRFSRLINSTKCCGDFPPLSILTASPDKPRRLILVAVPSAGRRNGTRTGAARRPPGTTLGIAAALLIVIIVGGIVGGVATSTAVSSAAVTCALAVGGLAFREMNWRSFADFLVRSASLSGMILFIVAPAEMLSHLLTVNLIPQQAAALAGIGASTGTWVFPLIAMAMLIVMGSVLEGAPALIVFGPLLFPAARKLGVAPPHFGVLLINSMGIGLFAPPLGVGLYTACAVGEVPMAAVARPVAKCPAIIAVALLLIAFVPAITLALPRWLGVL